MCLWASALLRRSQDIALAMERRGLGFPTELGIERVIFRDIRFRFWDYVIISLSVIGLITVIVLFGWGGKAWTVLPDETWKYLEIVLANCCLMVVIAGVS